MPKVGLDPTRAKGPLDFESSASASSATSARRHRSPGAQVLYDRRIKVGILTGGGDCPGLNAVIRAAGRRVMTREGEVVGVLEGWKGLVEGLFTPLGPREISGLLPRGGTILRTTRTNPFKVDGGVEKVLANFEREGFDALVAIGGEDTLGVAARLYEEYRFPVVGVPIFFQAEDGIRDYKVTGVQTCALPI